MALVEPAVDVRPALICTSVYLSANYVLQSYRLPLRCSTRAALQIAPFQINCAGRCFRLMTRAGFSGIVGACRGMLAGS